jgi:Mrp family chromosome partitioning ATPase
VRSIEKEHENVETVTRMEVVAKSVTIAGEAIEAVSQSKAAPLLIDRRGIAAGPLIESFRLLALNINRMLEGIERRSILVVSGLSGDGRSLTALGLARALREISAPVLLLDADPVGSGIGAAWDSSPNPVVNGSPSRFQLDGQPGLYKYLPEGGKREQSAFLRDVIEAIELAEAEGMTTVIDTPACLHSTIAFGLASHAGGVVYVARPNAGHRPPHQEIRNQLDLLGANVLGVVVNEG